MRQHVSRAGPGLRGEPGRIRRLLASAELTQEIEVWARRLGRARPTVSVCAAVALAVSAGLLSTPESERAVHPAVDKQSSASDPPYLQVDGRFLAADGEPFFWLADTAWAMLGKLSEDEITDYLDVRAQQGFNVVQTVAMFPQAGAESPGDTVAAAAENGPSNFNLSESDRILPTFLDKNHGDIREYLIVGENLEVLIVI